MRKRFPNILRVLLVLALVASLVAITAAPASANVTAATVTPAPATAGDAASYTVAFNVGASGNLTAGADTISITFPAGTTLPTSIGKLEATVNGTVLAVDATVSGQTVSLITPVAVAGGGAVSVVISQVAGIKNPSLGSTLYQATVNTSIEPNLVASTAYTITPKYSISATTGVRGTAVTVTGVGWTPNSSIAISNALVGTGTSLADGTFSVTAYGTTSGAVNVTDGAGGSDTTWGLTAPTFTLRATVTVTPTSGKVGSSVLVRGYDFTTNGNITPTTGIKVGGVNWGPAGLINLSPIDAYGNNDDFVTTLTARLDMNGAQTVLVTDTSSKTGTATFTVATPTITLSPATGPANTMVNITGSNFAAADTITAANVLFAGTAWAGAPATTTIDASGGWTASIRVPATAVTGSNPVVVTTQGTGYAGLGVTTVTTTFTVSARALTLSPSSGPIGTRTTVSGTNMTAGATITAANVLFAGAAWTGAPTITIDSLGNLSPTTLTVPSAGTGAQTVQVTDTSAVTSTGAFTVTQPTITIAPTSGYRGDTVTLTGSGWVPGTLGLVSISFAGSTILLATPDANGDITAQFTIPATAGASNSVAATDIPGNTAPSQTFLLLPAGVSVAPTSGPVGTEVTVSGIGFQPQSVVTALTIGGGTVLPATALITDTLGSFTTTFTVPGLGTGAQTVSVTVFTVSATTFFTITAAPATVTSALAGISDELVRVWGYSAGAWQMYDPADPIGSDLASLTEGRGYWVNVDADCTLIFGTRSWDLTAGWNLIGW